jgi:hypothetical protein
LRRLLRIRELEEEQNRMALESALGDLHRLENALSATIERGRQGRRLVEASARTGQLTDRLAGIEETRSSGRHAETLGPRIDAKGEEVTARRQEFFLKRVERRQAENLIEESEAQEAIEAGRRGQQALDDRYGSRLRHAGAKDTERPVPAAAWIASQPPAGSMDGEENESSKNKT